ncbi:MAG: M48 family metalloprotease [Acidobacteriales bacterium]|nr:M48 family metalloprotease [Terriglobales bacterium]
MTVLVVFALILESAAIPQCDWAAKVGFAIQRRYKTNEAACQALAARPEDFNAAHAMIEDEILRSVPMTVAPRLEQFLKANSDKILSQVGMTGVEQKVHLSSNSDLNAFATGQNVTLHVGLVEWYLNPESLLTRLGISGQQARYYLGSLTITSPRENGLVGVLAHETAHNILGHPDVSPLVLGCEDYIESGIREIKEYEQLISTGKKGSRFAAFFRAAAFLGSEVMLGSQRQQQYESDADELGAWLAYRVTGDPNTMARSLQWLAAFPGASFPGGWTESLCSDHPQLLLRVSKMQAAAWSVANGPPRKLLELPQRQTTQRYQQFTRWYPARLETIQRIAAGNLTLEEKRLSRVVQLELKPKEASGWLDGDSFAPGKLKLSLGLGPHTLVGEYKGIRREYQFVVLDEGPDKFKLEIK